MRWSRSFLFLIASWLCGVSLHGQGADRLAFEAASRAMEDGQFARAAREFGEFAAKYPDSPLKPEAVELAVKTRGEHELQRGDFAAAARTFAAFEQDFAQSARIPLAAYGEALAWLRQGDAKRCAGLLANPQGAFQRALAAGRPPEVLFKGLMLLAEAELALKDHPAAEAVLGRAEALATEPLQQWQRLRLLVEVQSAGNKPKAALASAGKLRELGAAEPLQARRAEANALLAGLLMHNGEPERALPLWEENARTNKPVDVRREAVLNIGELNLARDQAQPARERLEEFARQNPADIGLDRVRLLLGRVLFRQYRLARPAANGVATDAATLLAQALAQFEAVLATSTNRAVTPHAQLGRGWCLWEDRLSSVATNRLAESALAFQAATMALPHSPEQAVARLKLADCQFSLKQPAPALTNYLAVADGYQDLPAVQDELLEPALAQAVLAGIEIGDLKSASGAMDRLLALGNDGARGARSLLLVGQALARTSPVEASRDLFEKFLRRFPESPKRAEVQLALASSLLRERKWADALPVYDQWLATFTNHPALPRAAFDRAWAATQAGATTNSVAQFADLAARYPTNALALTAQLWLGGHFYSTGDYRASEMAYVAILTNATWQGLEPWHEAQLRAARAALAQRTEASVREAHRYLTNLINLTTCPTNLLAHAFFTLGETILAEPPENRTNSLKNYRDALSAFGNVEKYQPDNELLPAAWGQMGRCHLMLGYESTTHYGAAAVAFQKVVDSPIADVAERSDAKVGLGRVAERMGQVAPALDHYLDVLYGRILRPGEVLDLQGTREAGLEAARLLEESQRWAEAAKVYERLGELIPTLKPVMDQRAARARDFVKGAG